MRPSPFLLAALLALPAPAAQIAPAAPAPPAPPRLPAGRVIFHVPAVPPGAGTCPLRGSRFGAIGRFQAAVAAALADCRRQAAAASALAAGASPAAAPPAAPPLAADGCFGPATRAAIVELSGCPDVDRRLDPLSPTRRGAISDDLWQLLGLPLTALPSAPERARDLEITLAGADYDESEWTLGTEEATAVLYWGPFGAALGGGEVQAILAALPAATREAHFGAGDPTLAGLLAGPAGGAYAFATALSASERRRWKQGLAGAGGEAAVRAAYDRHALCDGAWLRPRMKALHDLISPAKATEIDHAFFLDLAVQLDVTPERLHRLFPLDPPLPPGLSPAARRQLVGTALAGDLPNCDERAHRLVRNVAFLADDTGIVRSDDEKAACLKLGCLHRASDFGLVDERSQPLEEPPAACNAWAAGAADPAPAPPAGGPR